MCTQSYALSQGSRWFSESKRSCMQTCFSGERVLNVHQYFKGWEARLKKQSCVPTVRATEMHVAGTLPTMVMRVFLGKGLHAEDSSYTILAVSTRCMAEDKLFKKRHRILPPGPNCLAKGRYSKGTCKMINSHYKPTFGTLWAETTCICCACFFKVPWMSFEEQKSAAPHMLHSTCSKLILVTNMYWMPGARPVQGPPHTHLSILWVGPCHYTFYRWWIWDFGRLSNLPNGHSQ